MQISEMLSLKSVISQTSFPIMAGAALITVILTFIALPLGVLSLAGTLYLYFLCRPLLQPVSAAGCVVAPAEGVITALSTSSKGHHIRIQQRWDGRLSLGMPISGRVDQNLFVDGAYLPLCDAASEAMNARREFRIEANDGEIFELIQWGTPTSRYLFSSVLEGEMRTTGTVFGLTMFAGMIELIIPESYTVSAVEGAYAIAGQTVLAKKQLP